MSNSVRPAGITDDVQTAMVAWRHELHAHPELAFKEVRTAAFIAARLTEMGLDVATGIGGTGVVGTLRGDPAGPSIGLRAEMDALPIEEETGLAYASVVLGVMHACGHDGHCAMLLGAAKHLSTLSEPGGTLRFIFQPAEENEAGARAMIEDGLFERFPVDSVYALHNEPGMALGRFSVRSGTVMAALDLFDITVEGEPGHAARPGATGDAIACAAAVVSGLEEIREQLLEPIAAGALRVTRLHGGHSLNVLPGSVRIEGTARTFDRGVQDHVEERLRAVVADVCSSRGCTGTVHYLRHYPSTVNTPAESEVATTVARSVGGADSVRVDQEPLAAAEDFAFMLEERPGCYALIGNGDSARVHTPRYDFDDAALAWGAAYWISLAEHLLASG